MSFLTKINFAWPLVPNVKLEKEAAIWRYRLLAQHNIIDHKSLFEDYGAFCKKKLSKEKANFWVKKILSKEFDIDEVEKGIIIVTGWLLNAENLPAETIVCFDRHLNSLEKLSKIPDAFLAEHDQRIKYQRTNFESLGQQYLEKLVARTRAKIAAKEIIAIFNPNIMIPHLISLTPRYLKCHLVNDWFEKIRHLSVYGKNEQKKEAELVLKKTLRSMNINKNKIKKRHYAHWGIYFRYRRLRSWLSGF